MNQAEAVQEMLNGKLVTNGKLVYSIHDSIYAPGNKQIWASSFTNFHNWRGYKNCDINQWGFSVLAIELGNGLRLLEEPKPQLTFFKVKKNEFFYTYSDFCRYQKVQVEGTTQFYAVDKGGKLYSFKDEEKVSYKDECPF